MHPGAAVLWVGKDYHVQLYSYLLSIVSRDTTLQCNTVSSSNNQELKTCDRYCPQ